MPCIDTVVYFFFGLFHFTLFAEHFVFVIDT